MKKNSKTTASRKALRRATQARLRVKTVSRPAQSEASLRRLQHEPEVHQIELEQQNAELQAAQAETATALERFTDLHDFAPLGCFNLMAPGSIRLVNLIGDRLVGIARARLIGRQFNSLPAEIERRVFGGFLAWVVATRTKQACKLALAAGRRQPLVVQLEATLSTDESECRAVMFDITRRSEAEAQLKLLLGQMGGSKTAPDQHTIVAYTAPQGKITDINDRFCAITQYSRAELIGQDYCFINSGFPPHGIHARFFDSHYTQ